MLSKSDLINRVAEATESTKVAAKLTVEATLAEILRMTGEDVVILQGFGTFKRTVRAARTGHNPKTGEAIQIAEKTVLGFKAAGCNKDL